MRGLKVFHLVLRGINSQTTSNLLKFVLWDRSRERSSEKNCCWWLRLATTWAKVIFRVKWIVFVSRWCYKSVLFFRLITLKGAARATAVDFEGCSLRGTKATFLTLKGTSISVLFTWGSPPPPPRVQWAARLQTVSHQTKKMSVSLASNFSLQSYPSSPND